MEQKKNSSNVHGTTTKVVLLPGLEFSDVVVLSTGLSGAYIRFGGAISGEYSTLRNITSFIINTFDQFIQCGQKVPIITIFITIF